MVSLLALIVILVLPVTSEQQQQPVKPSDTDALTMFRSRVDVHGNLAANWSTPDACSGRWRGVGCSASLGRVISLSLPSLDLRGPLDPLSHLDQLRLLDLHNNRINGTLLPALPSLLNLKHLYLSSNDLSGPIPPALARLSRLLRLDLSGNDLSGPIPSGDLFSNLLTLRLDNNLLSGPLPDLSSTMPRLASFNASNNQLYGRAPDAMLAKFGAAAVAGNARLCGPTAPLPLCSLNPPPAHPTSPSSAVVASMPAGTGGTGVAVVEDNSNTNKGLSRGAVMAIVAGNCLFLLLLLSVLTVYCCCSGSGRGLGAAKANHCKVAEDDGGHEMGKPKRTEHGVSRTSCDGRQGGGGTTNTKSKLVFLAMEDEEQQKQQFDLEDLLRASAEMVGKGSLGTVYRAMLEDGRTVVAVKRLRDSNPCSRIDFHRYMDLIGRIRHRNLVPLRAYYFANQEKLLIYDFYPNGTLQSLLHGNRGGHGRIPLDWTTRIRLVLGVARGLARIHSSSSNVPHGNVKSCNVLVDRNGAACVSDFGLSLLLSPVQATARLGGYMAPEQATEQRLSQAADVYAYGVLLLEVLTGRPASLNPSPVPLPQTAMNLPEWVRSVVRDEWTAEVFDPELMDGNVEEEMVATLHVGLACVAQLPERRPTMSEVVRMIEDIRAERSPLPEDGRSPSPSLVATSEEEGRLSSVTTTD